MYPTCTYSPSEEIFVIAWQDYRSGSNYDIYASTVELDNTVSTSYSISTASSSQSRPDIAYDSFTGYFMPVWYDIRNATSSNDIWGQRLSTDGSHDGVDTLVFGGGYSDTYPAIAFNSICSNFLTVFESETKNNVKDINSAVIGEDCAIPAISVSSDTVDFGDVDKSASSTQTLDISNIGGLDLIATYLVDGVDADLFTLSDDCSTVYPGTTCTLTITFTPGSKNAKVATLKITSNDPKNPLVEITFTGNGTGGCGLVKSTSGYPIAGLFFLLGALGLLYFRRRA